MSIPISPLPPNVTYLVSVNSGEQEEYATPVKASRFVAHNVLSGRDADVQFKNTVDLDMVRSNFTNRVEGWLRELGHNDPVWYEPLPSGAHYRLHE